MAKHGNKLAFVLGVIGATGAVAGSFAATRAKQEKARKEGRHVPYGPYEALFKRPIDVMLSAGALIVLSPIIGATAVAVRAKLGSPVIFRQERPGKDAEPFEVYKFRTMTDESNAKTGELLPDEERLTEFGKWLRRLSLDELPELMNILQGDMALIGPRPLLMSYLPFYTEEESRRHDVRPGLTGLAQINGRNLLQWSDKFRYDVKYVDSITFVGDAQIFLTTFSKLLKRTGVLMGNQLPAGRLDEERLNESTDRTGDSQ